MPWEAPPMNPFKIWSSPGKNVILRGIYNPIATSPCQFPGGDHAWDAKASSTGVSNM